MSVDNSVNQIVDAETGVRASGGVGTSVPAFDPLTLTPVVWYDFSLLVGADGSGISTFNDGSGNSRTLTQVTGSLQPLVKAGANGINGLKVALCDGIDDTLASGSFAQAQPCTVYAVVTGGGGGQQRYFSSADLALRCGYNVNNLDNFAGTALTVAAGVAANPKVITSVFNGASSLIRLDGTQVVAGNAGAGTIATGVTVGSTGAFQFWGGKIGEILVHTGTTVSTSYEAALKSKWGTP